MSGALPRRGILVFGTPEATLGWAVAFGVGLGEDALAVSVSDPAAVRPRDLKQHLGKSLALVVLDAHAGLDPDALAACHGFVRAGGALVVRMSPESVPDPKLAAWPYTAADVGRRFEARARELFARHFEVVDTSVAPLALAPPPPVTRGTDEQTALVAALTCPAGGATVLMADRGRGKSAALGLAARVLLTTRRVAVTASSPDAAAEVLRFAPELPFIALEDLAAHALDVLIIDEAATLPVPSLRRLTLARPETHLVFMTTVHGYEGTGRGFALRFVPWLESQRPTARHTLREPIRWAADCPLERAIFEVLVLDADLPPVAIADISTIEMLDRQAISDTSPAAERDLADLFGLLVHAHYRTSPSDLRRLLDAPNLAVHVARVGPERRIGAACLVAREGGFTPELSAEVAAGHRVQAHALADALVAHLGATEAGPMTMVRSVRIATHPALRRMGLARALVEHVHDRYDVDLFGTLFGAAPELLAFRRALGYRLVRVSASRNQRTGEPSVLMVRPVSARARTLVARLECALARELPTQLELFHAEGGLEPELVAALRADLPAVEPYSDAEVWALVQAYADGPRTFESVATAVNRFVATADLSALSEVERRVVEARARDFLAWESAATCAGLAHAGLAMKTMRRAIRRLAHPLGLHLSAPTAITRPKEA